MVVCSENSNCYYNDLVSSKTELATSFLQIRIVNIRIAPITLETQANNHFTITNVPIESRKRIR